MLNNVDSSTEEEDLIEMIGSQNPCMKNELVRPIFKYGPKDRQTVHWVKEVSPRGYNVVVGR